MASVPLHLSVTDTLRYAPATEQTQQAMAMDKQRRKEVQLRLNLAGHNVGRPDGVFGPKTRQGISNWQMQNALTATGYLNMGQLELLTAATESSFRSHLASNPNALVTPRPAKPSTSSSRAKPNTSNQVGAFAAGVVSGIVGSAILGR